MAARKHVGHHNKYASSTARTTRTDPERNPAQGTPQYIQLSFPSPVIPKRIELTFQGGFVGTRCSVECLPSGQAGGEKTWQVSTRIYPEDVNRKQTFELDPHDARLAEEGVDSLKLVFEESSDFFGRITVYDMQIFGTIPLSQ